MPGTRCQLIAGWIATIALAGCEVGEAAAAPVVLPIPLDCAIDTLTAAFIIGMSLWTLAGRLAALRARDAARVDALYDALGAAYGNVRLPVPPGVIPLRPKRITRGHLRSADREEAS